MLHDIEPWVRGILNPNHRLGRHMSHRIHFLAFSLLGLSCSGSSDDTGAHPALICSETMNPIVEWDGETLAVASEPCGQLMLQSRVLGQGTWTVDWIQNEWGGWTPHITSSTDATFEGLVLEGAWSLSGESEAVFWRQGYQSWSWSGVTLPGEATLDEWDVVETGGDGDGRTVNYENDRTSWWVGALGRADGGSLLLGAQGATKTRFFVGVNGEQVQAVWGHRGEQIQLASGDALTLDPLWIGMGSDPHHLHTEYADATTARIPARSLEQPAPTGWATWYQYYSHITEEDTRANLEALITLQANPELAPVDVFQIDDGWQVRWGDWWAGEDFPSGMSTLAEDIQSAGMTPGLWLAPFYMSTESDTYTEQPDWWVLDDDGEPIRFSNLGTGDYVILDVTHPDAAAWLRTLIEEKVAQGYGYLKLDFLYAGAMEGQRVQDVTGIEAYHLGMQIMREAAGDAWILSCGAPLLPTVGYAESFRTASDIAFESSTEPKIDFYRWQARSTAARAWTQGRWWWMDPDQVLVHPSQKWKFEEHSPQPWWRVAPGCWAMISMRWTPNGSSRCSTPT